MTTRRTEPEVPVVVPVEPDEEPSMPFVSAKGTRDVADKVPPPDPNERITMIAHDLKTPLSIIMLEAQLLGDGLPPDAALQHSIDRIMQNVAYVDRLIGDLLDLASVEAGQFTVRADERVDLALLLGETIARAVSTVDRERVRLELRKPAIVRGDRNRLERVIANFISNALKYSAAPVLVALDRVGSRARVCVIDQGPGLTPEQARTVFDRYQRLSRNEGHGLGLYISRKIIDAHRGKIGVVSIVDQGSEFFFELDVLA